MCANAFKKTTVILGEYLNKKARHMFKEKLV